MSDEDLEELTWSAMSDSRILMTRKIFSLGARSESRMCRAWKNLSPGKWSATLDSKICRLWRNLFDMRSVGVGQHRGLAGLEMRGGIVGLELGQQG